mmetsp:Transcript_47680/g.154868  ORF Transcript_47680/g.154868 Transcript_47680/m.154868 type:complete len:588 (+) Transcript_47680:221-1984(+)
MVHGEDRSARPRREHTRLEERLVVPHQVDGACRKSPRKLLEGSSGGLFSPPNRRHLQQSSSTSAGRAPRRRTRAAAAAGRGCSRRLRLSRWPCDSRPARRRALARRAALTATSAATDGDDGRHNQTVLQGCAGVRRVRGGGRTQRRPGVLGGRTRTDSRDVQPPPRRHRRQGSPLGGPRLVWAGSLGRHRSWNDRLQPGYRSARGARRREDGGRAAHTHDAGRGGTRRDPASQRRHLQHSDQRLCARLRPAKGGANPRGDDRQRPRAGRARVLRVRHRRVGACRAAGDRGAVAQPNALVVRPSGRHRRLGGGRLQRDAGRVRKGVGRERGAACARPVPHEGGLHARLCARRHLVQLPHLSVRAGGPAGAGGGHASRARAGGPAAQHNLLLGGDPRARQRRRRGQGAGVARLDARSRRARRRGVLQLGLRGTRAARRRGERVGLLPGDGGGRRMRLAADARHPGPRLGEERRRGPRRGDFARVDRQGGAARGSVLQLAHLALRPPATAPPCGRRPRADAGGEGPADARHAQRARVGARISRRHGRDRAHLGPGHDGLPLQPRPLLLRGALPGVRQRRRRRRRRARRPA